MKSSRAVAGLILFILIASGCSFNAWSRSDEFVEGLKCGQSLEQVEEYAQRFDKRINISRELAIRGESPELDGTELASLVLHHPDAYLHFGFKKGSLETVHVSWVSGVAQTRSRMRENLCTGEVSSQVSVSVRVADGTGGAYGGRFAEKGEVDITINGDIAAPSDRFWLPAGKHEISVQRPSGEERSISLENTDRGRDGYINLTFYFGVDAN